MKNSDIITLYETLNRITEDKDLKFNVTIGYAMAKNKEALREAVVIIYDKRREIIMEHGEAKDGEITVPKEYVEELNDKINELLNIDTPVDLIMLPVNTFDKYELNLEDMEGIMHMIQPFNFTE